MQIKRDRFNIVFKTEYNPHIFSIESLQSIFVNVTVNIRNDDIALVQ
jgi:hypothetical protein